MTRREYLASKGLAKLGRGKFSAAAIAELDRARREDGIIFLDDDAPVKAPKPTGPKPAAAPKPKRREDTGIAAEPQYRYTEATHVAREVKSGKVRSLREACRLTRVSMLVCPCDVHKIVATDGTKSVDVVVTAK